MENLKDIDNAKKSGMLFNPLLEELAEETLAIIQDNNLSEMDITDMPISPTAIEDDETEVVLSEEVIKEYEKLIQLINEPSTALEYPMVLLGKLKEANEIRFYSVEKILYCNNSENELNSRVVSYDQKKLNEALKIASKEGYNFISLAHTHPNIPLEERNNTISKFLSKDKKEQFGIRDAGLNISLQDLVQYESIYKAYANNSNIRTFETIIMYNGEITMFGKTNGKYNKMVNIYNGKTFDNIPVSHYKEITNKNIL